MDVALGYPPELKQEKLTIWPSIPVMPRGTIVTAGAEKMQDSKQYFQLVSHGNVKNS